MADNLKPFTCTYRFEGRPIGITIEARSWEEVSSRLRAIGMTGVVEGEQIAEFEAFPGLSLSKRGIKAVLRLMRRITA
nr:hypothetical protein [uncultured Shinella sp.]